MRKQLYWLSDAEWKRLEPLLPRGRRGAHRVYDRRVISGIVHMLRPGARWRDCPPEYGPYTTIYNRFNGGSRQGLWFESVETLTGKTGIVGSSPSTVSHIKAHRSAAGEKWGAGAGDPHPAGSAHGIFHSHAVIDRVDAAHRAYIPLDRPAPAARALSRQVVLQRAASGT
ncbi:transposase [Bradyrhizobium sp. Leo121]|uniref:transposase n=1 Tax=Bradyrhizobium sp. Leo121 TaxID=1571195 RepID=UPI0010292557|nr:transposase [Bradyrhizobium sp. Leo121]RZN32096.1 hypothetical protein CWO90_14650 [Bradyrhizobium sp. Leo121]